MRSLLPSRVERPGSRAHELVLVRHDRPTRDGCQCLDPQPAAPPDHGFRKRALRPPVCRCPEAGCASFDVGVSAAGQPQGPGSAMGSERRDEVPGPKPARRPGLGRVEDVRRLRETAGLHDGGAGGHGGQSPFVICQEVLNKASLFHRHIPYSRVNRRSPVSPGRRNDPLYSGPRAVGAPWDVGGTDPGRVRMAWAHGGAIDDFPSPLEVTK